MFLSTTPTGVAFFIFAGMIKAATFNNNKLEFLKT